MNIGMDEKTPSLQEMADRAWDKHQSNGLEPFMVCPKCTKKLGQKAPVWPKTHTTCPEHGVVMTPKMPKQFKG